MSGRHLATIRVVRDGQEYVINQTDYRYPDNTVRPEWAKAKVIAQNDLTEDQIEVNTSRDRDDADKAAKAELDRMTAKQNETASLVDEIPTGDALAAFIADLPNKGAVLKFAQEQGHELDASLLRPELNAAAVKALTQTDGADQEGGD